MARMLINTSSEIAQIARSRPIPFDISCERYERGNPSSSRIEIRTAIWQVYASNMHASNVHKREVQTYRTSAGKGKRRWRRKEKKTERKTRRAKERERERQRCQIRQKASPISQTCPICIVCKINHVLLCHIALPRSPEGPTIFKSIAKR